MTELILSQVQVAEMRYFWRVHGLTLCNKVRNCEIPKALNVEPLSRIEISATLVQSCDQNVPGKINEASPG